MLFSITVKIISIVLNIWVLKIFLCKIGYSKSLENILPDKYEYDFLMYGRPNKEGLDIIKKLNELDLIQFF